MARDGRYKLGYSDTYLPSEIDNWHLSHKLDDLLVRHYAFVSHTLNAFLEPEGVITDVPAEKQKLHNSYGEELEPEIAANHYERLNDLAKEYMLRVARVAIDKYGLDAVTDTTT